MNSVSENAAKSEVWVTRESKHSQTAFLYEKGRGWGRAVASGKRYSRGHSRDVYLNTPLNFKAKGSVFQFVSLTVTHQANDFTCPENDHPRSHEDFNELADSSGLLHQAVPP